MGLLEKIKRFGENFWPARVAPFVEMVASEIEKNPDAFIAKFDAHSPWRYTLSQRQEAAAAIDQILVENGVTVLVDFLEETVCLSTYYFDDIELNWREERRIFDAVTSVFDSYQDEAALKELFNDKAAA